MNTEQLRQLYEKALEIGDASLLQMIDDEYTLCEYEENQYRFLERIKNER